MKNKANYLYILIFLSILPFFWLFTKTNLIGSSTEALANILGLVGSVILWWQIVLGFRFLFKKIFPDFISITNVHINLGIYGTILVLFHPLLEMTVLNESFSFLIRPDLSSEAAKHITYGRIAILLFLIVWVLSAILRKKISYRWWKYIHYITYPMMLLVFLHAIEIGTFLNSIPWVRFYWLFFAYTFYAILAFKVLEIFNLGKTKYTLVKKELLGNDIVLYTLKPRGNRFITPKVGQFAYIKANFVGESHPFSVAKFDENNHNLTFGIKASGPFTKKLRELTEGKVVYIDGPYGVFTEEAHNNYPKVVIAGGIGITPFVQLIEKYGDEKTYMFYANKTLDGAIFRNEFKEKLGDRYKDVISDQVNLVNDESVLKGKLSQEVLQKVLPKDLLREAKYFICGPKGFMTAIKDSLVSLGVQNDSIFMEEFSL